MWISMSIVLERFYLSQGNKGVDKNSGMHCWMLILPSDVSIGSVGCGTMSHCRVRQHCPNALVQDSAGCIAKRATDLTFFASESTECVYILGMTYKTTQFYQSNSHLSRPPTLWVDSHFLITILSRMSEESQNCEVLILILYPLVGSNDLKCVLSEVQVWKQQICLVTTQT